METPSDRSVTMKLLESKEEGDNTAPETDSGRLHLHVCKSGVLAYLARSIVKIFPCLSPWIVIQVVDHATEDAVTVALRETSTERVTMRQVVSEINVQRELPVMRDSASQDCELHTFIPMSSQFTMCFTESRMGKVTVSDLVHKYGMGRSFCMTLKSAKAEYHDKTTSAAILKVLTRLGRG